MHATAGMRSAEARKGREGAADAAAQGLRPPSRRGAGAESLGEWGIRWRITSYHRHRRKDMVGVKVLTLVGGHLIYGNKGRSNALTI